MQEIFFFQHAVESLLFYGLLGVKAFALFDAMMHKPEAFTATGKQTKQLWCIFLGLAFVSGALLPPISLLGLVGTVAALVYLADVRPAVREISRRR